MEWTFLLPSGQRCQCLNILLQSEKMSRIEPGACGLCGDMAEAIEGLCGGAEES